MVRCPRTAARSVIIAVRWFFILFFVHFDTHPPQTLVNEREIWIEVSLLCGDTN